MLLWMILILLGMAHENEDGCPPFPHMERLAAQGRLTPAMEVCLEQEAPMPIVAENMAWVLWLGRWRSSKNLKERDAVARQLLEKSLLPDRALWAAGLLIEENPKLASEALDRTESLALKWKRISQRLDQLQVLFRLRHQVSPEDTAVRWAQSWTGIGVTGPYLDEALKACKAVAKEETCLTPLETNWLTLEAPDHWMACQNTLHLWTQRMGQRAYSTERDCLIQAAHQMPKGKEKDSAIRLALLLAMSREEPHVTGSAMRLFAPTLKTDPKAILVAAEFHRKYGDEAGARWWQGEGK